MAQICCCHRSLASALERDCSLSRLPREVREILYTTNTAQVCECAALGKCFALETISLNDAAVVKLIYLALQRAFGEMACFHSRRNKRKAHFAVMFDGRSPS